MSLHHTSEEMHLEVHIAGGGERKQQKGNRSTFGDNTVATLQVCVMI